MIRTQHKQFAARLRGFTIIEMLVTIGILVVVAAGVATIFASVGDVVSKGRKLSELNQFAARIERVMRDDFDRMTRDGFLVIVNKNANFGEDVRLYRGEQTDPDTNLYGSFSNQPGRVRRNDEIMFFARGDFESARRAISPGMIARSSEAAIYYGLGQKRRPLFPPNGPPVDDPTNFFFNPQPWDNNFDDYNGDGLSDSPLGVNTPGFVNPNEFARDWSLLRQVTLLVNPRGNGQPLPQELFELRADNPTDRQYLQDSARQVALQPAARSIFNSLNGSSGYANRWLYDTAHNLPFPDPYPNLRVSGMVDIVTQDLASIRNMIQAIAATAEPRDYFSTSYDAFQTTFYAAPTTPPRPSDALTLSLGGIDDLDSTQPNFNLQWASTGTKAPNMLHIRNIREWMIDALPSGWDLSTSGSPQFVSGVRYEDIPTRLLYTPDDFAGVGSMAQQAIARAYAEANQEMLGSSVFVPRCTEFIVEWSYGFVDHSLPDTDPNFKRLVWYGLNRFVDSDNDGKLESNGDDQLAAITYAQRSDAAAGRDFVRELDPGVNQWTRTRGPLPELVVGRPAGAAPVSPDAVEIATFGFATKPGGYPDGSGGTVPGDYWPWPKLIRITMRLGDPTDKDIEQTYQVVFEVPDPD